jgi:ubiquinone/menaquinone biosynthesis C-methylase UbiE
VIHSTISAEAARRLYDWLGARYDWAERYEGRAKARAIDLLGLAPGLRALNVGVGTGLDQARLEAAVQPDGRAFGVDLAPAMLELSRARAGTPLCRADARRLPFSTDSFDRLFSSYVLDLIPAADLPGLLAELRRVLRPGGRLALVSLTEGADPLSRAAIAAWKLAYRASPLLCGGCRPLQLGSLAQRAGFTIAAREVVVQLGVPSEVLVALR